MTSARLAAICAAVLLLPGCMQSDRDLFAASEKVDLPVAGSWKRVSGYIPYLKDEAVITRAQGKTYTARGLSGVDRVSSLSFVSLEGTGHYVAIGADDRGKATYYVVRMVGADIFVMEMGCPAGRIAGIEKYNSDCRVRSRAALLAAAYDHLSDPKHHVGTGWGALFRRSAQ